MKTQEEPELLHGKDAYAVANAVLFSAEPRDITCGVLTGSVSTSVSTTIREDG